MVKREKCNGLVFLFSHWYHITQFYLLCVNWKEDGHCQLIHSTLALEMKDLLWYNNDLFDHKINESTFSDLVSIFYIIYYHLFNFFN